MEFLNWGCGIIGFWFLVFGFWFLVFGFWFLVVDLNACYNGYVNER